MEQWSVFCVMGDRKKEHRFPVKRRSVVIKHCYCSHQHTKPKNCKHAITSKVYIPQSANQAIPLHKQKSRCFNIRCLSGVNVRRGQNSASRLGHYVILTQENCTVFALCRRASDNSANSLGPLCWIHSRRRA